VRPRAEPARPERAAPNGSDAHRRGRRHHAPGLLREDPGLDKGAVETYLVQSQAAAYGDADIGDFIRAQLPKAFAHARVECGGDDYVETDVGKTLGCTVASAAQSMSVTVKVEDQDGSISIA
jgi:hypothetical protein